MLVAPKMRQHLTRSTDNNNNNNTTSQNKQYSATSSSISFANSLRWFLHTSNNSQDSDISKPMMDKLVNFQSNKQRTSNMTSTSTTMRFINNNENYIEEDASAIASLSAAAQLSHEASSSFFVLSSDQQQQQQQQSKQVSIKLNSLTLGKEKRRRSSPSYLRASVSNNFNYVCWQCGSQEEISIMLARVYCECVCENMHWIIVWKVWLNANYATLPIIESIFKIFTSAYQFFLTQILSLFSIHELMIENRFII